MRPRLAVVCRRPRISIGQRHHFNIRQADMAESVGWMMLQLEGDDEALDRGVRWLEDKGIKVAPIEQDIVQ